MVTVVRMSTFPSVRSTPDLTTWTSASVRSTVAYVAIPTVAVRSFERSSKCLSADFASLLFPGLERASK